jgi:hypothetical protein
MADSRLKENAAAVKKLFGTAAQLAQKQAALATLNNVTLPKLYHAIGKRIVGLEKLPPDLLPHRDRIRALEAAIATKPEEPATAPAEGFAAKAKQLAQAAAQKASKASSDAAATMQIQAAYVALGKDAVEKYGDKAVPKQLVPELESAKSRAKELSTEIEALGAASAVGFLTPRRAAIAGLCLAALLVAVTARSVGRMVFGGSAPRAQQSSVASKEPSLGLSEKLSAVKEDLERKREEIAAEAKTREVEAREQDLARRERELQEKSRLAESARSPEPRAGTPTTATSAEKPKPRELSPLSPTYPVILAEDFSQINFKAGEFTNRLTRPSSTPVLLPKDLDRSTSRVPRSAEEAVKSYEGELKALMACPRTLSLSIKEPLSDKLYLAYWSGNNCLLQAEGGPLATKSFYIPVTCSHCVSFSLDGTKYENVPLLVMAGKPEENQTARDKALLADLAEKEASLRRAAGWLVYFALLEMPLNKDDVTEDLCSQLLLLPNDAAARDQIVKALHTVGSDTLSNDAPALYYALQCRNPAMIADCFARKQPTNGKEYGKREFLPAGCAMMLTSWFKSMGGKQEQEKVLQTLEACRVDWGVADDLGRTPLVHAILNAQEEAVSYLASKGHGLKSQDKEGRTPLMYAVSGEAETLEPLLTKEAVRGKDKSGNNVLHYCSKFREPVLPLYSKLVDLGAEPTAVNSDNDTALHSLVRVAIAKNLDPGPYIDDKLAANVRSLFSKGGATAKNNRGETPLAMCTHANLATWVSAMMFPVAVTGDADHKDRAHSVVMNDKRVLAVANIPGQRIAITTRDERGTVVGKHQVDGEIPSLSTAQALFGGRDGLAFLRVNRGEEQRVIALGSSGKQLWETEPYEEIDNAVPCADGSCVVVGKPLSRPKHPGMGEVSFLRDRLFMYRKNGKREWGFEAGGPLRGEMEENGEELRERIVHNEAGLIAGQVNGGSKSDRRAVVSFGSDGRVLATIPTDPGKDHTSYDVRAVLPDGSIVTQGRTNDAEVVVTDLSGKERFRRQLGLCANALQVSGNDLVVLSLADDAVRLSRLGGTGELVWEADLEELDSKTSNDFNHFHASGLCEGPEKTVVVAFHSCMAVVDAQGKIVAVARQMEGEPESPRFFGDGTIVWPVASGGFLTGNYKSWLQ